MKNVHLLPTEKPSRLFIDIDDNKLKITIPIGGEHMMNQNIYITSEEEIKEGVNQWYLDKFLNKPRNSSGSQYGEKQDVIILTTDTDLISDGVQAIEDDFLEWFVNNPTCEWVETFIDTMGCTLENCDANPCINYKIIIPKEKPKQEMPIVNGSYSCTIQTKKRETLEEAAESYSEVPIFRMGSPKLDIKRGFELGAKWQQEQDKKLYSEEEVKEIIIDAINSCTNGVSSHCQDFDEWFEENKKK